MTSFPPQSPYRSESASTLRYSSPPSNARTLADQVAQWREDIRQCGHPVVVFDSTFRPILLNEPLRVKLSDPATEDSMEQPTAFVWQTICETAGRIVADAAQSSKDHFAEAFPVHQRCFVAVGSIRRNDVGRVIGAIANLGDLTDSRDVLCSQRAAIDMPPVNSRHESDDEDRKQFQQWSDYRDEARRKMSRLSRRESQVVELVADGLPNKSIARVLDISVKTIEKHRANATRKLGVGSTAEVVRIAVVAGGHSPVVEETSDELPESVRRTF